MNARLWKPGNEIVVDESICRYQGRNNAKTKIPNKPTPEGFKIWVLAQLGFFICWNFYRPGKKYGPVDVRVSKELGQNKTQGVLAKLVKRLPGKGYHIVGDNLFTSNKLVEYKVSEGNGYTGTCRTNSGIAAELVEKKKADKGKNEYP